MKTFFSYITNQSKLPLDSNKYKSFREQNEKRTPTDCLVFNAIADIYVLHVYVHYIIMIAWVRIAFDWNLIWSIATEKS